MLSAQEEVYNLGYKVINNLGSSLKSCNSLWLISFILTHWLIV